MANSKNVYISVPSESIQDGSRIHSWRIAVTSNLNSLANNAANASNSAASGSATANQALQEAILALSTAELALNVAVNANAVAANAIQGPVPGSNTQIIFNQQGNLGAAPNVLYQDTSLNVNATLNVGGNDVLAMINAANAVLNAAYNVANNALGTAISANTIGTLAYVLDRATNSAVNSVAITANAALAYGYLTNAAATEALSTVKNLVAANASNLSIVYLPNNQVVFDTRLVVGGGGGGNYQVDVYETGVVVNTNNALNFTNTQSINLLATANGSLADISATINASLNLTSLNVSANIANAGNLLVTQNIATGNLSANGLIVLSDQSPPVNNPPTGNLYLFSNPVGGTSNISQLTVLDELGATINPGFENHMVVFNNSGNLIAKGSLVYMNGSNKIGSIYYPNVALACANSGATMPVIGYCQYNIPNGAFGEIHTFGSVSGASIPVGTPGTILFASESIPGAISITEPILVTSIIQAIGYLTHSGPGNQGTLFVTLDAVAALPNVNAIYTKANSAYDLANQAYAFGLLGYTQANNIRSGNTSNITVTYEANNQIQIDSTSAGGGGGNTTLTTAAFDYGYTALEVANSALNKASNALNQILAGAGTVINDDVFTATANQTVFVCGNGAFSAVYVEVTRNGLMQTPNVHYTWLGNTVTFTSNTSAGDEIAVREFTAVNVMTNFSTTVITFTANATQNQTTFALPTNIANPQFAIVSKNGLLEVPTLDYTIVSNNQLVFSSNCNVNDRIEARLFPYVSMGSGGLGAVYANGVLVIPGGSINFNNSASVTVVASANGTGQANVSFVANTTTISSYQAVATTNQTSFTLSANCPGGQNYAFVTVNGVLQEPGTHYTISSNTALTFTSNLQSGDIVEARIMGIWTGGTAGTVKTLQQNVNLGLANAAPGGGPNPTYFFVPGVCNFGLISQFTITTNQIGTFDVYVTSNTNNTGNVMLAASVYQSNTYNISTPWYYEADSSANGDNNLYITVNNWGAGTNLNVNVAIIRCAKFG